jgi:23S rRNA (guanosine2251-2'-O)-methyltransferase
MLEIAVLLHGVRSAHNVGSIFRTCDAAGVSRIFLTGVTPTPTDRFGRAQKEIAKVALGAEKTVSWTYGRSTISLIRSLRAEGWHVVGVEQDDRARNYREYKLHPQTLFVFGNEVKGLPPAVRASCDTLLEIPMHGTKESLNVSVAAGIILFNAINS